VVEHLSDDLGTSKASIREDLWPNLLAVHDSTLGGDPDEFAVAKHLGLRGEDHLAMHGIPRSRREAKKILAAFEEDEGQGLQINELSDTQESDADSGGEGLGGAQSSLDSF
jgi:hypothetical protein